MEELRIDKWLWSVRLFKTRSLATEACKAGKVKIDGDNTKPSKTLKVGEIVDVTIDQLRKRVQVVGFPKNRQSAKTVSEYMTDLTPTEEYERIEFLRKFNYEKRYHGVGRPTKKDRREIDELKGSNEY